MLRRRDFLTCSTLSVALALAACSDDQASPSADSTATAQNNTVDTAKALTQSVSAPLEEATITCEVGPAVRTAENVVVRIVTTSDSDSSHSAYTIWSEDGYDAETSALVLVDFSKRVVYREMDMYRTNAAFHSDEPVEHFPIFGPVEADTVSLFLPRVGLITDIPVVDESSAEAFSTNLVFGKSELEAERATAIPLSAFTESYSGYINTADDEDSTTMTLTSDVLFDSDSYELSEDATEPLQTVADKLATDGGGSVTITGHTDDVDTEEYNQELSEKRAQAVLDELESLTDLSDWDVTVEGKGETEPRDPDDTDEARAVNRRVEIVITPDETDSQSDESTAVSEQLPEALGPVGTAADGVDVLFDETTVHISLPEVHRIGNYLAGNISVTALDGDCYSVGNYLNVNRSYYNLREEYTIRGHYDDGWSLALLDSGRRYYPSDYPVADSDGDVTHIPLSGNSPGASLDEGETLTFPVIWPDTEQETVVLDLQSAAQRSEGTTPDNPFRITDIPVVES